MLKESKTLEFKKEMSDTFLKTVSAFANFGIGTIMFGVDDNGDIIGVDDMKNLRLDIENKINDSIDPIPDYMFEEDVKNKVLSLIVKEGINKPYFYKSKTYMRKDTSTIEVDRLTLTRLILEGKRMSYDMIKSHEKELTFKILEKKLKEKIGIETFDINILKTLGLHSNEDGYNIAAELLADKNNDYGINIARFGDNINIILDRTTIDHVSIIEQYYKALEMFRHYYVYEEIEGAERVRKEKVPENAFREAIANALVHRAWDDDANINISFYDDRIEILSPGGLPKGMTEKEYLEDKLSKARNPIIANVFFRLNLIERLGTGVQRINAEYKNSVNKPKYKVSDNLIVVTLPLVNATTQTTQTTPNTTSNNEKTTPNIDITTPKTTPNSDNTTPKKTIDTIITLIKSNNKITAAEIADKIGLTRDGVRYHLDNMKNKGMIKHCGSVQNGYWEILKED